RQDSASRRLAARLANAIRRRVLADGASDTGCGLKVFRKSAFLTLPYFDHMHRYLPALMAREGFEIAFAPVSHRPRLAGRSKYTNLGRLGSALFDLAGMVWLKARAKDPGPLQGDL
ncbi:MAG: dolichol-phosphate mannosyltransferase, partial [Caulobacteraceae bacterium]